MDRQALEILEWLAEMGDDVPLAEAPVDRFAQSEQIRQEMLARRNRSAAASKTPTTGSRLEQSVAALKQPQRQTPQAKPAATFTDATVHPLCSAHSKHARQAD